MSAVAPRSVLLSSILMGGLLLKACSGDSPAAQRPAEASAPPVVVAQVVERRFTPELEALGTARALESVMVTSRVSGRVEEIHFQEGARVAAQQPLVRLEDDEERAELAAARAAAEQAQSRYRRMQELAAGGAVSKDQIEEQGQVTKTAQARLELARVRLEQRLIQAPFAGVLGFRQVSLGALVQPGSPIVSLDAIDTIRAEFSLAETQMPGIAKGIPVEVQAAAYPGRIFRGTVNLIGTRVDEQTRAVPLQARIPNKDGALKRGMLLSIRIQLQPRQTRFVPEAAIAPENSRHFVWRLAADGSAEKVEVALGSRIPGWVEVTGGVQAGDLVVVEGHTNLVPGRKVRVVERHPVRTDG